MAVNEYGYPAAQYDQALAELKAAVAPQLPRHPFYDDRYIGRFLRARKLDHEQAKAMLLRNLEWRRTNNADTILQGPPPDERIARYLPHALHGRTKQGNVIYIERTGRAKLHLLVPQLRNNEMFHWKIWIQEKAHDLSRETGVETGFAIMDMDGLQLRNATKPVLDFYQMVGAVEEANYPETLCKIFVINASWVFTSLWKFCKFFFAEEIRQKICIYGNNYERDLLQYVDASVLPNFIRGGTARVPDPWAGDLSYMAAMGDRDFHEGLEKEQVGAGKQFRHTVVAREGDVLAWDYCTEKHNINFSLIFGEEVVVPEEKVECHDSLISGSHKVTKAGAYTFVWSNEYSYMKGKTLLYKVHLINDQTMLDA